MNAPLTEAPIRDKKETDDQRITRLRGDVALQIAAVVTQIQKYESGKERFEEKTRGGLWIDRTSDVLARMYADLAELHRTRQELN